MFTFGRLTMLPQLFLILAAWLIDMDLCGIFVVLAAISAMIIYRPSMLYCNIYKSVNVYVECEEQGISPVQLESACLSIEYTYVEQVDSHWFKSLVPTLVAAALHYVVVYAVPQYQTAFMWTVGLGTWGWVSYTTFQMMSITAVPVFESKFLPESLRTGFHATKY